jgi:hypothetical protein
MTASGKSATARGLPSSPDLLDLAGWPKGIRVIARKERPHPAEQLRFTDIDGHRVTCFATSTRHGQLADLELRHRRRARCEDRIRCAKDTGLRNVPLHGYAQNQIWCEIVALACELLAWMAMLALNGPARKWEPKRLRLRRSQRPAGSSAAPGGCGCAWPPDGPGPPISQPRSAGCRPWHPADQATPSLRSGRSNHRARGTPPTRRDSRAARHGTPLKTATTPPPQATRPRSRKIEANIFRTSEYVLAVFWRELRTPIGIETFVVAAVIDASAR